MQITSKWMDGMCFVATDEAGHSVVMEGSAAEGCVRRGPSPMEMLLMGVAGCSSTDEIHIHFTVTGRGLKAGAVEQAVRLSAEKYCSASIMLGKTAKITHSFEIVEA